MTSNRRFTAPGNRPRGISLLEVLISIGILTVGLLSALALVPVGRTYLAKAAVDDRAAAVVHSAYDTLTTARLLAEDKLVLPTGARVVAVDPIMVARRRLHEQATPPFGTIPRIAWNLPPPPPPPPPPSPQQQQQQHAAWADRVFRTADDLEVDDDVRNASTGRRDEFAPPRPVYSRAPGGDPLARQARGRMSWLVMLQPEAPGPAKDHWHDGSIFDVSIVIFQDRTLPSLDPSVPPPPLAEYFFPGTAWYPLRGVLEIPVAAAVLAEEDIRAIFRTGSWVLLAPAVPFAGPPEDTRQRAVWLRAQTVELARTDDHVLVTIIPEKEPPPDALEGTGPAYSFAGLVFEGVVEVVTRQLTVQGP
jgi:type II secretory pathway pseudopilin PulG